MNLIRCFPQFPSFKLQSLLGETYYTFELDWSEGTEAWHLTLSTATSTPIVTGVRLEPGMDALYLSDPAAAPPGKLLVVDAGGCGRPETRSVVGLRFYGPTAAPRMMAAGTIVSDGTQQWIVTRSVYKGIGASVTTEASPEEHGAITAEAGTITTIVWPAGLGPALMVTNPGRATPGQDRVSILQADLGVSALLMYVPPDEIPPSTVGTWAPETAYIYGQLVVPLRSNGRIYRCTVAGTSGDVEPVWPYTLANTVTDGGATWEAYDLPSEPRSTVVTP
jgi:hypothetical protein